MQRVLHELRRNNMILGENNEINTPEEQNETPAVQPGQTENQRSLPQGSDFLVHSPAAQMVAAHIPAVIIRNSVLLRQKHSCAESLFCKHGAGTPGCGRTQRRPAHRLCIHSIQRDTQYDPQPGESQ